jgi:hypothetical protein
VIKFYDLSITEDVTKPSYELDYSEMGVRFLIGTEIFLFFRALDWSTE